MSVAFVQDAFARTGAATTLSPSLTGVAAGNTLVLAITGFRTTSALPTSVSDGVNIWRRIVDLSYAGNTNKALLYIATDVAGGDTTVTATWASNFLGTAHLSEWSGVDPITPGDVFSTRTGTSTAPLSNATPAIEQSGSMAIALLGMTSSPNNPIGIDLPSGYTNAHLEDDGANYEGFSLDYKAISTAGSTENPNWGTTTSGSWGSVVYILRPPGGRAIRYIGGQTTGFAGGTGTANITIALTGGAEPTPIEGDLILVNYTVGTQGRNPTSTITGNQSGAYSHVTGSPLLEAADTYDTDLSVFWQFAGSTPDTTLTRSATGSVDDGGSVSIHVYRGVDSTTPFDVTPTTATGINTDRADPASITPTTSGALIVVAAGGSAATLTTAWTAAYLSKLIQSNGADTNDGRSALGNVAWSSGAYNPAAFTGGSNNAANSWAAITMALRPAPTGDNLAANGVSAGTPSVGSPALGQTHALSATGVACGMPTVGSPILGQVHALSAASVSAGTPTVGAPTLTEAAGQDDLTATGVSAGVPSVGSPAIGQRHALTATGVAAGTPATGTPAIGQQHAVTATCVAAAAPSVGAPALGQRHGLTATGVSAAAPSVGSSALGQAHALTATGVATGAPTVGAPVLSEDSNTDALTATSIAAGTPAVGSPAIGQTHAITASPLATPAPVTGAPAIGQVYGLGATSVSAAAPSVGSPAVGQRHALSATGIAAGIPAVGEPAIGQAHQLLAVSIAAGAPPVGSPDLADGANLVNLTALGITAGAPIVSVAFLNYLPPPARTVVPGGAARRATTSGSAQTVDVPASGRAVIAPAEPRVTGPASDSRAARVT